MTPRPTRHPAPSRSGFTLVELLAVIAIIGVLTAVVLVAAGGLSGKQKIAVTQDTLNALDRALESYHIETKTYPDPPAEAYEFVPGPSNQLVSGFVRRPDAAVFIRLAKGLGEVDAILAGIPDRFLVPTVIDPTSADEKESDTTPSVLDAWGTLPWPQDDNGEPFDITQQQVIYYVTKTNRRAQDLYGAVPTGGRPYFMSAGPDMNYGFVEEVPDDVEASERVETAESYVEDNIYSYPGVGGTYKKQMPPAGRRGG